MAASEESGLEGQDSESVQGLGLKLQQAREAQELAIDAVAAELRIGVDLLNALEESRFDDLGAQVFAKGYLKQYAARLGLDVPGLVAEYEQLVGDKDVDITPSNTITLRDERQITVWIVAAFALVSLAAILWVWWWLGSDQASETASENTAEPEVAAPVTESEPPEPAAIDEPLEASPGSDEIEAVAEFPQSQDDFAPDEEQVVGQAAEAASAIVDPGFDGPWLEIRFVDDSWTDITSDTGERLYYDLGRAGTTARVPADRGMNVFFGNAAGVELILDGEPFTIPASARRGDLAQFDVAAVAE